MLRTFTINSELIDNHPETVAASEAIPLRIYSFNSAHACSTIVYATANIFSTKGCNPLQTCKLHYIYTLSYRKSQVLRISWILPPRLSHLKITSKQILPHCTSSQLRYCNKTPIRYESLLAWFIIMKHSSQLLIVLGIFLFPREFTGFPHKDCRGNHSFCKKSMGHENRIASLCITIKIWQ